MQWGTPMFGNVTALVGWIYQAGEAPVLGIHHGAVPGVPRGGDHAEARAPARARRDALHHHGLAHLRAPFPGSQPVLLGFETRFTFRGPFPGPQPVLLDCPSNRKLTCFLVVHIHQPRSGKELGITEVVSSNRRRQSQTTQQLTCWVSEIFSNNKFSRTFSLWL